jgi:hypothetical protein
VTNAGVLRDPILITWDRRRSGTRDDRGGQVAGRTRLLVVPSSQPRTEHAAPGSRREGFGSGAELCQYRARPAQRRPLPLFVHQVPALPMREQLMSNKEIDAIAVSVDLATIGAASMQINHRKRDLLTPTPAFDRQRDCWHRTAAPLGALRMLRSSVARRILVKRGSMPPRRPVSAFETKEQKFRRLANYRTNLILDGLRKLGNLSNQQNYEYAGEDVERIFASLEKALSETKGLFTSRKRRSFSL